jgi:hypothetical protein
MAKAKEVAVSVFEDFSEKVIVRVDPTKLIAYVQIGVNEFGDREVKGFSIYDTTDAHIIMHNLKKQFTRKDGTVVANTHIGKTPGLKFFTAKQVLHISRTVVSK